MELVDRSRKRIRSRSPERAPTSSPGKVPAPPPPTNAQTNAGIPQEIRDLYQSRGEGRYLSRVDGRGRSDRHWSWLPALRPPSADLWTWQYRAQSCPSELLFRFRLEALHECCLP